MLPMLVLTELLPAAAPPSSRPLLLVAVLQQRHPRCQAAGGRSSLRPHAGYSQQGPQQHGLAGRLLLLLLGLVVVLAPGHCRGGSNCWQQPPSVLQGLMQQGLSHVRPQQCLRPPLSLLHLHLQEVTAQLLQ